jgi:hypothetical protein
MPFSKATCFFCRNRTHFSCVPLNYCSISCGFRPLLIFCCAIATSGPVASTAALRDSGGVTTVLSADALADGESYELTAACELVSGGCQLYTLLVQAVRRVSLAKVARPCVQLIA